MKKRNAEPAVMQEQRGGSWKQRLFVLFSLFAGLSVATQVFAHQYGYGEFLGPQVNGIYPPWGILVWGSMAYDAAPGMFIGAGSVGLFVSGVLLLMGLFVRLVAANTGQRNPYLHGSARWAEEEEVKLAGLMTDEGVFVGGWRRNGGKRRYLRHDGNQHILCFAPTRSGKGVCLVIPTLLTWMKSCVVTDMKGELWALTAGWRQKYAGQKVLRFEPASPESAKWNPLDEIRLKTKYETGDIQNLATLLADPNGKGLDGGDSSAHFANLCRSLLTGLITHVLYLREENPEFDASLGAVDALLSTPESSLLEDEFWKAMQEHKHRKNESTGQMEPHPLVVKCAQDIINTPTKERGSVLSTTRNTVALYRDEIISKNTSVSEFCIKDLMNYADPVTLYIITEETDKERVKPLFRLLLAMICRNLASGMTYEKIGESRRAKSPNTHKLLMLIDEFPSFGKLEVIQKSLAFLAGYGIRFYLIAQDLAQLRSREEGYGENEAITSNCHIQVAFTPQKLETAKYLSQLTGQTTVSYAEIAMSGSRLSLFQSNMTKTYRDVSRPLMTEDECLRMRGPKMKGDVMIEGGDMLLFYAGIPAIRGIQMPYFLDPVLQKRSCVDPPARTDITIDFNKEKKVPQSAEAEDAEPAFAL